MKENQVYTEATETIAELSYALEALFATLPKGTEVAVSLEDRLDCALFEKDGNIVLEERKASSPDVEICFFPESIRRLKDKRPSSLTSLATELVTLWLTGMIRYKVLSSPKELYRKGYVQAFQRIAPELQKEASRHAMTMLSMATMAVQVAKHSLNDIREKYTGKKKSPDSAD